MDSWALFLDDIVRHGGKALAAFLLALPIAIERERTTNVMGLRTLPLVSVACCGFVILGDQFAGSDPTAHARLLSGLIAGIGFIGGGAILKSERDVRGTATAASILATGVMGAAVGFGRYGIAALIALATFATLLLLTPLRRRVRTETDPREED